MTGLLGASVLLIALPLAGAIVLLVGGRLLDRVGHLIGCATVLAAFVLGVAIFFHVQGQPAADQLNTVTVFTWMQSGRLDIDFGLLVDPLSITFVLLITGVGSLIHIYSIGYMSHDADRRKFFAYLNLFVAAMLLLVLGDSFVTLYAGWEGVGLASYLLIGFWSDRPAAATAAKKAFIMNRVGDVGLALAIFLMFKEMGTVSYDGVFSHIDQLAEQSPGTVTVIALLLLLGACGKSGQVPLQAWLPDAMEGPTPVSALIHAATMVTAGVYLIARCSPIYDVTADGSLVVAIIGTVTLLVGCIGGCAKDDIKKVLAYSTVSQIGYMFLAVGLGAGVYALGILLLLCHGFFKAGLFLGAGSIMHAMNDDVDMRRYGGLARRLPITFATMACGYLAIIGFPLFDGFYAKDPIIEAAFAAGGVKGWLLGSAALIGAGITAFYMTRLMIMTFFGEPRWKQLTSTDGTGRAYEPHEAPAVMTIPMIILAVGSVGAGAFFAINDRLANWLAPSVGPYEEPHPPFPAIVVTIATLAVVAVGVFIAYWFIGRRPVPVTPPMPVPAIVTLARNDVGGNAINETLFARPGIWLSRASVYADARGVDGLVNGTAAALGGLSGRWRRWQNGYVRSYALSMFAGTLVVVLMLLLVRSA
ncbi:proton-translocating NADH-quinone oxidoreductase, chain L [Nakamurella multipartita DSM 44233]|uniref:Proton-translocating NADH-quinone oxidoreductase, chain L n=1 Tax=Nakamurella multipartita (strain ATCC 700099 / DSM 44233 / CIP 104796 / JCM 9543 / NBRC 105858 / Y-104) TaxID=479431 RepID=C8XBD2_NAKMY|nr:NADH-quinone oxidoreductase subunit L [Nakamurella multipartita]ACV77394.1 proton-translocating NADH-quinone oxidoreductase, chain L [Nakamurella multipartita DSM 44233]